MRTILITLLIIFSAWQAEARWATIEDASTEIISQNRDIKINADGSSEVIVETHNKVLNEAGRADVSHYMMYYTADSTEIKIIVAKTMHGNTSYVVSDDMIEDRPLASAPHGFDQGRQILISFPKIEVGAEIYLKYVVKEKVPPLDGVFSDRFYYGRGGYWRHAKLSLRSDLPLRYVVNDEHGVLKVSGDSHNIQLELIKPVMTEIAEGSEAGVLNDKHLVWLSVSSIRDWSDLSKRLSPRYSEAINGPMPWAFSAIVKKAASLKDEVDQINTVTSMLNERVQYMGDWRSVAGKFFPRPLATIADSRIGDCKDFATSTASMLRMLGYDAKVCLVMRGVYARSPYSGLPDMGNFNHAMVKVVGKSKKVYWIDPTNLISMAQGIFDDVADKMTLVLDNDNPSYERISAINPSHSVTRIDRTQTLASDSGLYTLINKGSVALLGERASNFTGARLYLSERSIKDMLFYALSGTHLDEDYKRAMILPDLSSRIVSDLSFDYEYEQIGSVILTNKGNALDFRSNWVSDFLRSSHDQVSDLFIGPPRTIFVHTFLNDIKADNIAKLNYNGDSPWLSVSRKCTSQEGGIEIKDEIVIKTAFIPSEELKKPFYRHMKRELEQNFCKPVISMADNAALTPSAQ